MKKLLNTLYVTSPDSYLSLDGENIVIKQDNNELGRVPLHNLQEIATCGFKGSSPALMAACAERNVTLTFLSMNGKFLARVTGEEHGNVVLRKTQYRVSEDKIASLKIAKNFIVGKIFNERWVIERATRDYPDRLDILKLKGISGDLNCCLHDAYLCQDIDTLRGIEGKAASQYFSVFDDLILQQKRDFYFHTRNRRPPLDYVNALISFAYTLLASSCASGLETVGLDPFVGFMHADRPGRKSLALDVMEELRSVFADRFVLSMINMQIITSNDFITSENGAVYLNDKARKSFITSWQKKKTTTIVHPFLKEKVEWGMVPYTQALLLARTLRGDIDSYPPFCWK